MKTYLSIVLILFIAFNAQAQTTKPVAIDSLDFVGENAVSQNNGPDKAPEFPGGFVELYRFLGKNIHYPDSAKKNHIQGTILIRIIIDRDGSVTNVKAINSISPDIDKEAIRVIESLPKWAAAIQNGNPVRVGYYIPVHFNIDQDDTPALYKAEVNPEFPGGEYGFSDYLAKNLRMPASLTEGTGYVTVSFIVEKDGSLSSIRIFQATNWQMANEALRLMYNAPKWTPGRNKNEPVRVESSVTIPFEPNN